MPLRRQTKTIIRAFVRKPKKEGVVDMSFNENENAIDYSFSETDVLKSAKSHVRYFVEVIIGIVIGLAILGFLLSTLVGTISCIGGCFGCEACIETAACADEMIGECASECDMDCSYEEITIENIENANDCVRSEGIDCFGREGCFACDGCGDCENWQGVLYLNVTIKVGDNTYSKRIKDTTSYLDIDHSVNLEYTEYLGLFDSETGGTRYVDENGYIVKSLYDNITLYAQYQEYNKGQAYEFRLKLETLGMPDETIRLTVGSTIAGIPYVDENAREGYIFKGWYLNDTCVIKGNVATGKIFHLYEFGIDPYSDLRTYTLTPKFEAKKYTVTFVAYGYSYSVTAAYNSTYADAFNKYYREYDDINQEASFFGWGKEMNTDPKNKVDGAATVTADITLYAIIREPVFAKFYYNTEDRYSDYIEVKFVEGDTNVRFEDVEELEEIMTDESVNPGYKFAGWYKDRNPASYESPNEGINNVNKNTTYKYYAKWVETTYQITYKVYNYALGEMQDVDGGKYAMTSAPHELYTAEDITYNVGYDFEGWSETEDFSGAIIASLPAYEYGTKVLYAYYVPDTYKVELYAPGGQFEENYNEDSMSVNRSYGSTYSLPVPKRTGYDFVGFFYDDGDGNADNDVQITDSEGTAKKKFTLDAFGLEVSKTTEAGLHGNISLYGKWTIQVFNVTFKVNGSVRATVEVEYGKTITNDQKPADPVVKGYEFKGWAYENGTLFNFTTPIKADQVLVAKLTKERYEVKFIYNGTEYTLRSVEFETPFEEAVIDSGVPGDTIYYRLLGWYKDAAMTLKVPTNAKIEGPATYYADVQEAKKFIFHNAEPGYSEQYYFVGESYKFPAAKGQEGYDFVGWCSNEALTGTPININDQKKIQDTTPREYWPKYNPKTYNIIYKYIKSGATEYTEYMRDTYTTGTPKTLISTSQMEVRKGYMFVGWTKLETGGSYITQIESSEYDHKTFYAQYTPNPYKVTLHDQFGNAGEKITVTYDAAFNLGVPANKEGYDFKGWSFTQNGTEDTRITDANGKSLSVYNQYASDKNVYPIYTIKTYDIEWYNTVQNTLYKTTKAEHFGYISKPENPSEDGYSFVGWYEDPACTEPYNFDVKVTGGDKIYAKFTINSYTVNFLVGRKEVAGATVTLQYKASLTNAIAAAMPAANQYAQDNDALFSHWEDTNGKEYPTDSFVPAANLTLKAIYALPTYMEFMTEAGKVVKGPYRIGEQVQSYDYTKPGYTFNGWYTDGTHTTKQTFPYTLTGTDVEMYGDAVPSTPRTYAYYPLFTAKKVTIYYYENFNGTTGSTHTQESYTDSIERGLATYTPNTTNRKGYVFKGWYVAGTKSESQQKPGTPTTMITKDHIIDGTSFDSSIYCYGVWEKAEYTISLYIGSTLWKTLTYEYGAYIGDLAVPTALDLPNGRTFGGWKISESPIDTDIGAMATYGSGRWRTDNGYDGYYNWEGNIVLQAKLS